MSVPGVSSCKGCIRPDDAEDMVACDECSQWWHYGCAGVQSSVCNRSWRCASCKKPSSYGSVAPSAASAFSSGTSAQLRLKQLEEAKALEDRLRQEKADKEREYLNLKHQLEAELEAERKVERSCASSTSHRSRRADVREWISQQNNTQISNAGEEIRTGAAKTSTPIEPVTPVGVPAAKVISPFTDAQQTHPPPFQFQAIHSHPVKVHSSVPARRNFPQQSCFTEDDLEPYLQNTHLGKPEQYAPHTRSSVIKETELQVNPTVLTCDDLPPKPPFAMQNQPEKRYPGAKAPLPYQAQQPADHQFQYPVGQQPWQNQAPPYWQNPYAIQWPTGRTDGIISAQQLAARHVVSKDLPKFSGDPLEWPMFLKAFESTTEICGIQPDENLARLQKSLVGSAREKVQSILTLPEAIPEIIATLREECGRPDQLVHSLLLKIRNAPPPNVNKLDTLVTFGREVRNLVTYIEAAKLQDHLSNPMLLSELVGKLPPSLRLDWGLHSQRIRAATLKAFSDFVSTIKAAACQVSLPSDSFSESAKRIMNKKEKGGFVSAHSTDEEQKEDEIRSQTRNEPRPCVVCQQGGHRIRDCQRFKGYSIAERWKFVDQWNLCQRCLAEHGKWPCRTKQPCESEGCEIMHHKLLHPGKPQQSEASLEEPKVSGTGTITTHRHQQCSTLFRIIPVTLEANGKSITVFAFLDDGSSLTLLESEIADELGLGGEDSPLCLQWTSNVTRKEQSSRRVQLSISNINSRSKHVLSNVRTVTSLGLPQQNLDYKMLSERFPYLSGLPVDSYLGANPQILIGLDNAKLMVPLCKREGRNGEPVATKTRLGWTIYGGGQVNESYRIHVHACNCSADTALHDLVKDFFTIESVGIEGLSLPESPEDQHARKILQETTKRTESGRYETGLLWKSDEINFPDSYSMAFRRNQCLQRQLARDAELKMKVDELLNEFISRGYAHRVSEQELQEFERRRMWFLPLGIVRNPRKPNKIRVVWDAAARVGDTSLNSQLLKGPDLLVSLVGVVFRFRQRMYAIAGDIRQMFLQLLMRLIDRQSQLFMYSNDSVSKPDIYMLDVATFGATCSPCSAQYVKNVNASEHASQFPEAAEAIIHNTYVDDYLDSRDTVDELVTLVTEVRNIHSNAGFEIRNWQSNAVEVLERIGDNSKEPVKSFSADKTTTTERVLGIAWNPSSDVLTFSVQFREDLDYLLSGEVVPTKRQVLRVVMSFFDPLGLISFYTVQGKVLIQDIWRSGVHWDDPIADADFVNWRRWITLTSRLDEVRIPRCYFPNRDVNGYETLQLHVFVDASEQAYCCVAYFRILDHGVPRCALVAAKSKVTPLKPQSIPRNELNAGVLGVRLMKTIIESHTIPITRRFIWTDSSTVLSWLHADPKRYRQYVGLRVAEILTDSDANEWNKVDSEINIADVATKWGSGPCFDPESAWFTGPEFLHQPEAEWNISKPALFEPKEELRAVHVHREMDSELIVEFTNFSCWDDLIRRVALLYHFVHQCQTKQRTINEIPKVVLSQIDYEQAERSIWRMVQAQEFPEEVGFLRKGSDDASVPKKQVRKTSTLAKVSPYKDQHGVIRMESRIDPQAAYYAYDFRNPVIIPKESHVTKLVILKFHQRYGHANTETVINELRQRYYIPKMRSTVGKVIRSCMWCRVYRATPCEPRMAPLPQPRVHPYVRPFTFTGLDYFGPIIIKRGRSEVKRWVALFTCLSIRAVHLEVVHSLTSESCKMAIRRFVAKRGAPQQIFSDNGTNFKGAARDLAEEIKAINRDVAGTFTNTDTEWIFNPPSAPHMGGVWERKVRSVKEAFKVMSHKDRLDDEGLVTLLAEVEMIVNSHPLTFVPLETPNQQVITPNSFLLMSSDGSNTSTRVPVDQEVMLRTNWKLMQHLLNQFWQRWIQAYLPTIARRTKWFGEVRPLKEGDLVVIVDEQVRNGWLRGKVVKVYPGKDGQVRKVDVQTSSGVMQRPSIKVALLDVLEDGKAG